MGPQITDAEDGHSRSSLLTCQQSIAREAVALAGSGGGHLALCGRASRRLRRSACPWTSMRRLKGGTLAHAVAPVALRDDAQKLSWGQYQIDEAVPGRSPGEGRAGCGRLEQGRAPRDDYKSGGITSVVLVLPPGSTSATSSRLHPTKVNESHSQRSSPSSGYGRSCRFVLRRNLKTSRSRAAVLGRHALIISARRHTTDLPTPPRATTTA